VYEQVLSELRSGRKTTHWMWFIFPQAEGLGHSETARYFSISSLDEAAAYLQHATLGPRLIECTRLVVEIKGGSIREIFGYPDDLKFRSSMTLFAQTSGADKVFDQALEKYFKGEYDRATLEIIHGWTHKS